MTYHVIRAAGQMYWIGGCAFSIDANEAVRLCRAQDAVTVIRSISGKVVSGQVKLEIVQMATTPGEESFEASTTVGVAFSTSVAPAESDPRAEPIPGGTVVAAQPANTQGVVATRRGRKGQVVKLAGVVPGTTAVQQVPGGSGIHRMTPSRGSDEMQRNWGKPTRANVPGMSDNGDVKDPGEFRQGAAAKELNAAFQADTDNILS